MWFRINHQARRPSESIFAEHRGHAGKRRGLDHLERRGQSAGIQREAAVLAEGGAGYGADYEPCELRQQSQWQIRLRDYWRS